ncbi:MAG: macro domain-containing protein, partial [Reichenbachiella sp.]
FWEGISLSNVGKSILSVFGALWLIVEILDYFNQPTVSDLLKNSWWVFLIAGLTTIVYRHRPRTYFPFEVRNRDVKLSIRIGDIFKSEGSIVVPVNHKLDVDNKGIVSQSSSILKHFIDFKYDKQHQHLTTDIKAELEDHQNWYSKFVIDTENETYKIGTVVPVFKDEQYFYLLCNSTLNRQNRSKCTEEDLRNSLNELWAYLEINGNKDTLTLPVIGTGRGRLNLTRVEVIKEIALSFLASLNSGSHIEELCIVIHPNDLRKYTLDINELTEFLRLHCSNTNYKVNQSNPTGVPLN